MKNISALLGDKFAVKSKVLFYVYVALMKAYFLKIKTFREKVKLSDSNYFLA